MMKEFFDSKDLFNEVSAAKRDRRPWLGKGAIKNISAYYSLKEFEILLNQTGIWTPDRLQVLFDNKPISQNDLFVSEQNTVGVKPALNLRAVQDALRLLHAILMKMQLFPVMIAVNFQAMMV